MHLPIDTKSVSQPPISGVIVRLLVAKQVPTMCNRQTRVRRRVRETDPTLEVRLWRGTCRARSTGPQRIMGEIA